MYYLPSNGISEFSFVYERGAQEAGLAEYQASQHDGHYHHSLFTVWSFESLASNAQSLLNVMSLLDPFNIQESVLSAKRPDPQSNYYRIQAPAKPTSPLGRIS